jgi:hypothetical protein
MNKLQEVWKHNTKTWVPMQPVVPFHGSTGRCVAARTDRLIKKIPGGPDDGGGKVIVGRGLESSDLAL